MVQLGFENFSLLELCQQKWQWNLPMASCTEGWGEECSWEPCSIIITSRPTTAKSLQSCPTLRPHRQQPTRLPRPWDSPGKNTGVGCHFLPQFPQWKVKVKSFSHVQPSAIPWTAAFQAPPAMGFSRQEYWSRCVLFNTADTTHKWLLSSWNVVSGTCWKIIFGIYATY